MTNESMAGSLPASPGSRPRTLGAQRLVNRIMIGLLATPGVSRGIGKRLVTLYVVGRKSGRRYVIPVAYTRHKGALLVGTGFGWGRNLRTGEPVEIRFMGRKRTADVQVLTSEEDVTAAYDIMCRDNKNFAGFNHVGYDADGSPSAEDLHLAWAAGARAFLLTPH
jgi:deazaflavin-dependent oxidoreductase (nitroreductase family)